jgi:hypothetical protein
MTDPRDSAFVKYPREDDPASHDRTILHRLVWFEADRFSRGRTLRLHQCAAAKRSAVPGAYFRPTFRPRPRFGAASDNQNQHRQRDESGSEISRINARIRVEGGWLRGLLQSELHQLLAWSSCIFLVTQVEHMIFSMLRL